MVTGPQYPRLPQLSQVLEHLINKYPHLYERYPELSITHCMHALKWHTAQKCAITYLFQTILLTLISFNKILHKSIFHYFTERTFKTK